MAAYAAPDEEKGLVPSNVDYFISLSLMALVQELDPTKHGRLVEFLCALQKQIATDPSTGESLTVDIDKEVLWTNLPSLRYTEAETWREFGGDYKVDFLSFCSPLSSVLVYVFMSNECQDPYPRSKRRPKKALGKTKRLHHPTHPSR